MGKKLKGFSFVEVLVAILLTGIVLTATIPVMTQMLKNNSGIDKNTADCLNSNAVDVVQNAITGGITQPTGLSACLGAITSCKNGSCDSLKYFADNGSTAQKAAAKKVLRASCDVGGEVPCDYFINRCKSNATLCNEAGADVNDLAFYLDKSTTTQSILGVQVIYKALLKLYDDFDSSYSSILLAQFKDYACPIDANSIGCNIFLNHMQPLIITKCNQGDASYCSFGYTNNLNRSCNQIKQAWGGAPDNTYRITTSTVGYYDTNCDMTSDGGGWTQVAQVMGNFPVIASNYTAGYGALTQANWFVRSSVFDTFSNPVMRINMGTSRSYFRPSGASTFSQMVVSSTKHKWANKWKDPFVYPIYYIGAFGGSEPAWTNSAAWGASIGNNATNIAGVHLNFWGANDGGTGGGYAQQGNSWGQAYTMWIKETSGQVTGADCNKLQSNFTTPADAPSGKYVLDDNSTAYCGMNRHRSCSDWYKGNTMGLGGYNSDATEYRSSGIYWINPTRTIGQQFPAYCDMTTGGGG